MVRDHMTVAAEFVIAIVGLDLPKRRPPIIAVRGCPPAHIADQPRDHALFRDQGGRRVQQGVQVRLDEGLRHHRRNHLRAVDRLAVVRDARGQPRKMGGFGRVAGADHPPAVYEDLRPDLLGDDLSVGGDAPAVRRFEARLQPQERRVLARHAPAAPPQNSPVLDDGVKPPVADLCRRQGRVVPVLGQGAHKRKGPRDVIIGDDKGRAQSLVDVIVHLAQFALDLLVGPALNRPAEINADDLSEDACIDARLIVGWNWHWVTPVSAVW